VALGWWQSLRQSGKTVQKDDCLSAQALGKAGRNWGWGQPYPGHHSLTFLSSRLRSLLNQHNSFLASSTHPRCDYEPLGLSFA
jgi:hypothetical protein